MELIEKKFCSSQEAFEFQIQKQRERLQQFSREIRLYTKYLKWMEASDIWGSTKSPTSKKGSKKKKQPAITRTDFDSSEIPVDYHLEDVKQQVISHFKTYNQELEALVDTRDKMRNAAALESDDAKDILQEVQTKNKVLTQDLDKKKAQLHSELQGRSSKMSSQLHRFTTHCENGEW